MPPNKITTQKNKQENIESHHSVFAMRSSVLPPPSELERYEKMYTGTTELFLTTYKNQVEHRINLEKTAISADIKKTSRGQIFAFILTMTAIIAGFILIMLDKSPEGLTSIIVALGALVITFISGSVIKKKERVEKENKIHNK